MLTFLAGRRGDQNCKESWSEVTKQTRWLVAFKNFSAPKTRGLLLRIIDPQMQGIVWIKSKARVMGAGGRNIYPCPSCIVYGSMCRRCLRRRTATFRSRAWATHAWYRWGCNRFDFYPEILWSGFKHEDATNKRGV